MSKIQIICSSPGMLRNGVAHPPSAIYEMSAWTDKQLQAFEDDPAFTVLPVADDGGVIVGGADIEAAVAARVKIASDALQVTFNKAVQDAVAEKLDDAKAEVAKECQGQLDALKTRFDEVTKANGELTASVSKLTAELEEAKAKAKAK